MRSLRGLAMPVGVVLALTAPGVISIPRAADQKTQATSSDQKTAGAPAAKPAAPRPENWERPVANFLRSPATLLMTPEELAEYTTTVEIEARMGLVRKFWSNIAPHCPAGANPVREKLQQRVTEANEKFNDEGAPGWLTDRGTMLVLAGAPEKTETKDALGVAVLAWSYPAGQTPAQAFFVRDRLRWRFAGTTAEDAASPGPRPMDAVTAPLVAAWRTKGCELSAEERAKANMDSWRTTLFEATDKILAGQKVESPNSVDPVWYFFPAEGDATFAILTVPLDKALEQGTHLVALLKKDDAEDKVFAFGAEDFPFQVRASGSGFVAQAARTLPPGRYGFALGKTSDAGTTTLLVAGESSVARLASDALNMSSVIPARQLTPLEKNSGNAPFQLYGFDVAPNPERSYMPGEPITVFFVVLGATKDAAGKYDLKVSYHIYFEKQGKWIDTPGKTVSPNQDREVQAKDFNLPASWPRGNYKLVIEVTDNKNGAQKTRDVPFTLKARS